MINIFAFFAPKKKEPMHRYEPACFILGGYNHERKTCMCYPECRKDCPDAALCLAQMPEYQNKEAK